MSASIGLIKRGFHEIPHIMVGSCILITNIILAGFVMNRHAKYDRQLHIWKRRYIVVREEDFDPKIQVYPVDRTDPIF